MPKIELRKVPLVGGEQDGDYVNIPAQNIPEVKLPGGRYTKRSLTLSSGVAEVYAIETLSDEEARSLMTAD